jgi:hypothetical protein
VRQEVPVFREREEESTRECTESAQVTAQVTAQVSAQVTAQVSAQVTAQVSAQVSRRHNEWCYQVTNAQNNTVLVLFYPLRHTFRALDEENNTWYRHFAQCFSRW